MGNKLEIYLYSFAREEVEHKNKSIYLDFISQRTSRIKNNFYFLPLEFFNF